LNWRGLIIVHYIQRECNSETAVPSGYIVKFDTPIALSQNNQPAPGAAQTDDFEYQSDGSIDILCVGTYIVYWYIVNTAGLSTVGQSYLLQKKDYSLGIPAWTPVAGTSNHIKVSQTPGFAIVDVSEDDLDTYGKVTVALFNTSDAVANLTIFTPKAGILIFGLSTASLEDKMTEIDDEITDIFTQLRSISDFIILSDVVQMFSDPPLTGIGVAVIDSGFTYNFWGTGTLSQQLTLTQGTTYTIISSSEFLPLTYYQGDSTIGTLWIVKPAPSSDVYSLPIHFDGTGIYFTPDTTYTDLPTGTAFRFTQSLILVQPVDGL
jgi:hypothetical protein